MKFEILRARKDAERILHSKKTVEVSVKKAHKAQDNWVKTCRIFPEMEKNFGFFEKNEEENRTRCCTALLIF